MGYYVYNCQKSVYKEGMHPQKLLCPLSYQYTLLTKELKEKIRQHKFLKLIEDAPDWDGADKAKLIKKLDELFFVYERNKSLKLGSVKAEIAKNIINNINGVHSILGDILVDKFVFEYS